jgi:chromosome segregation ATPase
MKRIFVLSMFISFAMICSCQKQDSAAEQQLAQQKAHLDEREKALDERLNALDEKVNLLHERVKALAEKETATLNDRTIPTDVQPQISDPAQDKAERDRRIQEVTAEFRALMADPSQLNSARVDKDRRTQERLAQRQRGPEQSQSQKRKSEMFGAAVFPAPEASSPTPSPAVEGTSPTPSPTP